MSSEELTGEISSITFRNEDNGYTVLKVTCESSPVISTAVGNFASINIGQPTKLYGSWSTHPKYGQQFLVQRYVFLKPTSLSGIKRYLSYGLLPGVGEKTAEKVVAHFREGTLDILEQSPERLREVPGIGRKTLAKIRKAVNEVNSHRGIFQFLANLEISHYLAQKIFELYKEHTIDLIADDPYRLARDLRGVGFLKADKIAARLGFARDSSERLREAVNYLLDLSGENGHCYETDQKLLTSLESILDLSPDQILAKYADVIAVLQQNGDIVSQKIFEGDGTELQVHYRKDIFIAEELLAVALGSMINEPLKTDAYKIEDWVRAVGRIELDLSTDQLSAVQLAASHRVSILTGGPGVGKTTTANAIIKLLTRLGRSVALCAPTGRAAHRLSEVSAMPAKTIHRLLEWQAEGFCFNRDETNPIKTDAIIVDECSMLDVRLAAALVRAIDPKKTQLVFIGDVDQLPSVGPGNVLRDLIDSERIPCKRLTQIFRQAESSWIIRNAHEINRGAVPEFLNTAESDSRFVEATSAEQIYQIIQHLLTNLLPNLRRFDPIRDVQVLSPMNKGELGTSRLNEVIKSFLNPGDDHTYVFKRGEVVFHRGDKVIQTANNYDLNIYNGDIGFVVGPGPQKHTVVVDFNGRYATYSADSVIELQLAYAITIHKSQGSEFPVVIIPVSMMHFIMLQRNLIYTGLTRAKKLALFIGSKKALNTAIQNQRSSRRQTCLVDRLTMLAHES